MEQIFKSLFHMWYLRLPGLNWGVSRLTRAAFESLAEIGTNIHCADGFTRCCHPIIGGMMVDYEEQVHITGIKKNRHCSICRVPPDERGDLLEEWKYRTHECTQAKLRRQRSDPKRMEKTMAIHPVMNWAWKHKYCNIHTLMDVDILHQLFEGVFMRLINWCTALMEDVLGTSGKAMRKRSAKGKEKVAESAASIQLDERFRQVHGFTGLKRFSHFSKVKQWSGNEQKAMVRQLVPVIAPLLAGKRDSAIHCSRATMDFVMLHLVLHTTCTVPDRPPENSFC